LTDTPQVLPRVSVIISTYERPEYLRQALDSVYSQTFGDYEVIVVDDGSSEATVASYELAANTRLIKHERSRCGCAATKNTGARAARGEYLAYLDDDDIWLPHKLESQVNVLDQHPEVGLVYCHFTLVDRELEALPGQPAPKSSGGSCFDRLIRGNIIKSPSTVMLRRQVIDDCGGFREDLLGAEDWEMWIRVACRYQMWSVPEPLVLYRTHPGQLTLRMLTSRRADVQVIERVMEWAEREVPDALPRLRARLSFRLQRLSKWEARENGYSAAFRVLCRAASACPWDLRNYLRMVTSLRYALVGRRSRGGKC